MVIISEHRGVMHARIRVLLPMLGLISVLGLAAFLDQRMLLTCVPLLLHRHYARSYLRRTSRIMKDTLEKYMSFHMDISQ